MAYSTQIIQSAARTLAERNAARQAQYTQHLQEAYARAPRLKQIDTQLRHNMASAAQAAFESGADAQETMHAAMEKGLALQSERKTILESEFAPGFLDETPVCTRCGGSGYVGSSMCTCLQALCLEEQKKQLEMLPAETRSFDAFRLDCYPDTVDSDLGVSPRTLMGITLQSAKQYARDFTPGCGNLLFVGGTGLGKTYLSGCIAHAVAQHGCGVVYECAPRLFANLEKDRFSPTEESRIQVSQYSDCDLLIIDDLGTEMPGNFVTAALYALVNQRLLEKKAMVISTNLNADEIAVRYSPQIASRLQGEFRTLFFAGSDIRVMKNQGAQK